LPQPPIAEQHAPQSATRRSSQENNPQDERPGAETKSITASQILAVIEYKRGFVQDQQLQRKLEDLERQYAEIRSRYTARHPESVHLQSEINRLRAELAGTASPVSGGIMVLDHVQDRTVFFKSTDGAASFSYGCADCTFFLGADRIGGSKDDGTPGALVHLSSDGKQLDITCRAARCRAIVNSVNSRFAMELQFGQSSTIPADKGAVILFD
jgi:hypothetical protein